ncbi:hypothetical protein ACHAPF_009335 [Botrytis cinerea]|uniref:Uncharacterized protein n=1 Tax=Botryotinia fuckeliana (strain T4) TaxID=999810 RepID=G2Y5C8_BOTF4|nr:predicted protein [Botrytis cinerea T4]
MSSSEETASDTSRQEVLLLLPLVKVDRRFRQALSKLMKSWALDVVAKVRLEATCVYSSIPEILYGADLS